MRIQKLKDKIKKLKDSRGGKLDMSTIVLEVVLFTALIGVIISQSASAASNASGVSATLIILIPVFIVIAFITYIVKIGKSGGK